MSNKPNSETIRYADSICSVSIAQGINIAHMEEDCGYSRGYLSRCKKGSKKLSIDAIKAFGEYVGIDFIERLG